MSKKIKVPYEYSSQFFGNSKRIRWLEIGVADDVTYRTFIPDLVPHTTTMAQLLLAEKACARDWLKVWFKDPRPLNSNETAGLLTILDMGTSEAVAAYGGDPANYRETLKHGATLPERESVILATAAAEKLER